MMEIEVLHTREGDKKHRIDTTTKAGRELASAILKKLMKAGTAILLERGKKTYYVKGYDPEKDQLIITIEKKGKKKEVKASGQKSKTTAVPRVAGGSANITNSSLPRK